MQGIFEQASAFFQVPALGHDIRLFGDLPHIAGINPGMGSSIIARHTASLVYAFHQLLSGWVTAPSEAEVTWAAYLANTPEV